MRRGLWPGIYDIIHNLGSLVARIVFAPLEESAHTFFSLNIRRGAPIHQQVHPLSFLPFTRPSLCPTNRRKNGFGRLPGSFGTCSG